MVKVRALITVAISSKKEVAPGEEFDINENEAKNLERLGFVEPVKKNTADNHDNEVKPSNDNKGAENVADQKSGG